MSKINNTIMHLNTEEINRKNQIVDNTIIALKKEFIGIDKQIDEIMDNVRTWYVYPQLQIRPIVINLWGMSGVGKTSLIRAISKHMNLEKDLVYFNFAEIGEMSSWEIENNIEEQLANEKSNRVFVYDEFQYAATLDKQGEEKDRKSGLKPFWELLDTGIIHKRHAYYEIRKLQQAILYLYKINATVPIELRNGVWMNAAECLKSFAEYEIRNFAEVFSFDINKSKKGDETESKTESVADSSVCDAPALAYTEFSKYPFFLRERIMEQTIELYKKQTVGTKDALEIYHELLQMSFDEFLEWLVDIFEGGLKGYDLEFHDSIIFVVGNLDEAYEVSFNVNPDMSPDQFHQITSKISIVEIKEALRKRFRNEQIARLGNIHVIYPSFSSSAFRDIIKLELNNYSKDVMKTMNINITYDNTIIDFIYKESVFPTHGTRPVFSSIYEIVKAKLPNIIRYMNENNINGHNIIFASKSNKTVVNICDDNNVVIGTKTFAEKCRVINLRKTEKNDKQAIVAVHEAGHFVVYTALNGKYPKKVVSQTASSNAGGFMLQDLDDKISNYTDYMNDICVTVAGHMAEKLVFGDLFVTSGASQDLRNATAAASAMVRKYSMGASVFGVAGYCRDAEGSDKSTIILEDKEVNEEVKNILRTAQDTVMEIFNNRPFCEMLVKSAHYLADHSALPQRLMKRYYTEIPSDIREKYVTTCHYRDRLMSLKLKN